MSVRFLRAITSSVTLLAVVLGSACGTSGELPVAPTSGGTRISAPAPAPDPNTSLSPFVGVWKVTLSLTDVEVQAGGGCVAETLQSQIGVPRDYVLAITAKDVTLTNPSDNLACTFETVRGDSEGFSTYGVTGLFYCNRLWPVRCGDQKVHPLIWVGQNIAGKVSGAGISGSWDADWVSDADGTSLTTKAQFKGSKQ
jgi:hypothetical protein